ncbi:uncharacterized protein J2Z40_001685 [Cytobacillus eiseniae]|uniref:DUF418 domain-containing protein n=1 Tax=Cytobacillus eiseniae TaxID=762947 RepID=A0ABS4RDZ0_9BACI|nr:DUF418 domain-containing protein [Cytobacillus eiseniae]MBP2241123.1 uncharacterized protein [Cytobacillus eiseniae]
MSQSLKSVTEKERIISLDIMRGFAILGIFLVNMLTFHSPFMYIDPLEYWSGAVDQSIYTFLDLFVQASFYPLFALLFGYGLMIMRERSLLKGYSFGQIATRRLSLLLFIGMIHAFLIWHGDILITYALMGFLFLLFMRLNGKNLIIIGIVLYVIPNLLMVLLVFASLFIVSGDALSLTDPAQVEASFQAYQNGSFTEITVQRFKDWYFANNLGTFFVMIISILPLFLIGGGVAKLKWLEEPKKHQRKLIIIASTALIIGLLLKLLPMFTAHNFATNYVQDAFGGPLLAIGYGLVIALIIENETMKKLLYPLSFVGKLSLSNYLLQSIVATFIFYQYGLGLYGKVSLATGTVIVLIIYIMQLLISRYWVKHFYYGPVEWVWRSFTYLQYPQWKRKNHE